MLKYLFNKVASLSHLNLLKTYGFPVTSQPEKQEIVLFPISNQKGINRRNFNSSLRGDNGYMKAFPGSKSTQLNHYVRPTLDEFQYDVAIIHTQ